MIRWWRQHEATAQDMQRKADEALDAARQQHQDVQESVDFVDRALRAFRRTQPS